MVYRRLACPLWMRVGGLLVQSLARGGCWVAGSSAVVAGDAFAVASHPFVGCVRMGSIAEATGMVEVLLDVAHTCCCRRCWSSALA